MKFFKSKRKRVLRLTALVLVVLAFSALTAFAHDWPFADVSVTSPFYDNIRRIAFLNISPTGCGGGNFCPKDPVLREQMAAYMDRLTRAWTDEDEPFIISVDHRAVSVNRPAIIAQSNDGNGVNGISYGAGFADNGVYGETNSTDGGEAGVYGRSTAGAAGVRGYNAANSTGVYGSTGGGFGVQGTSASGRGVYGFATNSTGTNYGVYGYTNSQDGFAVYGLESGGRAWDSAWWAPAGFFSGRNGLVAYTNEDVPGGYAVIAEHKPPAGVGGAGIYASTTSTNGWTGRFTTGAGHGVSISTPLGKVGLTVSGGSKNAVVGTDDGARLLYSEEATEVWFADYGFGQLEDGSAVIAIDPVFAQTVNLDAPYHVFVQVYGDAEVYVSNRTPAGFEVHLRDGDPKVEFSYRLVAQRSGFEGLRLERAPWADDDPNLFPGVEPAPTGGRAEGGEPMETEETLPPLEPGAEPGK